MDDIIGTETGGRQAAALEKGIKASDPFIFDLFFSSKGHRGTGLGLFVVLRIVNRHQGAIRVSSNKGEGSNYRVVPHTAGPLRPCLTIHQSILGSVIRNKIRSAYPSP